MYDLGWEVADRTRRLLDLAEGIRLERELRDARPEEIVAPTMARDDAVQVVADAPAMPVHSTLDCPPATTASRRHAA